MKGIKLDINFIISLKAEIFDDSIIKIGKENGLCVLADGKQSKGIYSSAWSNYLCEKTSLSSIKTLDGLKLFTDHIWEEFYEEIIEKINDTFTLNAFQKQGSWSTYTACWFRQEKNKIFYQWLSYGNSAVLIYNKKTEELFVPQYGGSLYGFLKNKGLINWKEDNLKDEYLLTGEETELTKDTVIILATDAMAEHLVLSYFIIKSKDDDYWEKLSLLMKSDTYVSDLLFNNRSTYAYNTFSEVLEKWRKEVDNNTVSSYLTQLQLEKRIAIDDITLQVISYNPQGPEYTTNHDTVTIKNYGDQEVEEQIVIPIPKPIKTRRFKPKKEAYLDIILDNKVSSLYHFTDRSNLPSIIKLGGLYSWNYMVNNKKSIPTPGGDQLSRMLDTRYGLQNYVRTSFCKNNPMLYKAKNEGRITDPVLLEIDPIIVTFFDTLFSDMNATKKDHKRGGGLIDFQNIRFDLCLQLDHFDLTEEEKSLYQAEVMVYEFIPAKYIMNLNEL